MFKLDKQQLEAVTSEDKNVLVVAGAGSGKTRVITERVRYLLDKGVLAHNIVCITFTNMASQEMKQRLSDIPTIGDAFIGTIHSFANNIYKTSGLEYRIFTEEIRLDIFREMLSRSIMRKPLFTNLSFQKYLKFLDLNILCEAGKLSEEVVQDFLLPSESSDLKLATKQMWKICKERNIITFSELLKKTRAYYKEIGGKLEYVLVDEFQDVGKLEADFVFGLEAENTFFVGDDWQSIYGFKGGDVEIFKDLIKREDFTTHYLVNNYRNSDTVMAFSQIIIEQVDDRIEKDVKSKSGVAGRKVEIDTKGTLTKHLNEIMEEGNFKDWFVLARSNKDIFEITELMEKLQMPYMSFKKAGMSYDKIEELMQEDSVKLLTVHTAKGLENKNVLLYGNFPVHQPGYFKNKDERKVMYVGVTRAVDRLIVLN